jgi:mono/diheme cytochrome c family protein
MIRALVMVSFFCGQAFATERIPMPEDPMAGARLFQKQGCVRCHSIGGDDGKIGPNLARIHLRGSLLDVAGAMWNHAPTMQQKMEEMRIEPPQLTSPEMANLVAFLSAYQYYLKQLGKPGDPEKGKRIFEAKDCATCHSLQPAAGAESGAPSLHGYAKLSPIQVAQAMWNHGPAMAEQFDKLGLSRPQFTATEMADLISYLQRAAAPTDAEPVYVEPGSPNRGRQLFEQKGCASCHSVRGVGGTPDAPDLGKRREEFVRSVTEVAGLMWNHGLMMWEQMKEHKLPAAQFQGNEMADIIAYLYFINYFDKPGDVARGKELFRQKGCIQCHTGGAGATGSNLSESVVVGSPIETITAMWNHARLMEPAMRAKGIPWPRFEPGEMTDLVEYIYSQHGKPSVPDSK